MTRLGYFRKFAAKNEPSETSRKISDAATMAALGGAGAVVGSAAGGKLNEKAMKRVSRLVEEEAANPILSPGQYDSITKKLGLNPKTRFITIGDPKQSGFLEADYFNDLATDITDEGKKLLQPLERRFAEQEAKGKHIPHLLKQIKRTEELTNHPNAGVILSDKNSILSLHEAGHASGPASLPENAGPIRRKLQQLWGKAIRVFPKIHGMDPGLSIEHPKLSKALSLAPGGVAAARQAHKELHDGEESRAMQVADYLGRAASGARLLEESQASARPLYHLLRENGLRKGLRAGNMYASALGTYLAPAIGAHVIAPLAVHGGFAAKRKLDEAAKGYQGK